MSAFFGHNFAEEENKIKALKNAYALLGKGRHAEAVAFFLLGDSLDDAVNVCVRHMDDVQLAMVICRLYVTPLICMRAVGWILLRIWLM